MIAIASSLRRSTKVSRAWGFPVDFVKDDKGTVSHLLLPASGDDIAPY